jgi:peptidyl-prolyl cis-trans isomerase C
MDRGARWLRGGLASRVVRSPLVHFVVLGGLLFVLAPRRDDPRRVEVPGAAFAAFERAQAARDGVQTLTADRAREVDGRAIEDEVLYREALRLGLDRDDPIIRQRLIQKLLLLVEDMGGASRAPTDAELRAYFEKDPARFALAPRVRFVHVFAGRREALPAAEGLAASGVPAAGEAFPFPRDVRGSKDELVRTYGDGFAAAAFTLAPGAWSAPVASSFGWHRLRIDEREAGRIPSFDEARSAIGFDYALDARADAIGAYLSKTVRDYRIDVDGKPVTGFVPTRRIAVRTDPSAED